MGFEETQMCQDLIKHLDEIAKHTDRIAKALETMPLPEIQESLKTIADLYSREKEGK